MAETDETTTTPADEPTETERCASVSPHGDACSRPAGHRGVHVSRTYGQRAASWGDDIEGEESAERDIRVIPLHDAPERIQQLIRDHLAGQGFEVHEHDHDDHLCAHHRAARDAKAAAERAAAAPRVRILELPRGPVNPGSVAPFVLVVDRLRAAATEAAEFNLADYWVRLGDRMGARTTIVELDELNVPAAYSGQ